MKPSEVLRKAADLIEPEGRWTRDAFSRDSNGSGVSPGGKKATCWCVAGAVAKADGDTEFRGHHLDALGYVSRAINMRGVANWNDAPERTQPEVVAALRKAAELAESEGM